MTKDWSHVPGVRYAKGAPTASESKATAAVKRWQDSLLFPLDEAARRRQGFVMLRDWLAEHFPTMAVGRHWWYTHIVNKKKVRRFHEPALGRLMWVKVADVEKFFASWARHSAMMRARRAKTAEEWVTTEEAGRLLGYTRCLRNCFLPLLHSNVRRRRYSPGDGGRRRWRWHRADVLELCAMRRALESAKVPAGYVPAQAGASLGLNRSTVERNAGDFTHPPVKVLCADGRVRTYYCLDDLRELKVRVETYHALRARHRAELDALRLR